MHKIGLAILLSVTLTSVPGSTRSSADARSNQDIVQAAQDLVPVALQDYARAKDRLRDTMKGASISFTVAAKRYDSEYGVVALAIHSDNASISDKAPLLDFSVQPIELSGKTIVRNIGNSRSGSAKAVPGLSPSQDLLHSLSFPTKAPEAANALLLQMTFGSINQSLRFIISLDANTRVGTGALAYPVTERSSHQSPSELQRASYRTALSGTGKQIVPECSCRLVGIDCENGCSLTNQCSLCNNPATLGCTDTGCFILKDSPSGCN